MIDRLMAELGAKSSDEAIAYRGQHRWVQSYAPIPLSEPANEGIPMPSAKNAFWELLFRKRS
ncbi:MAG: hypothetical protein GDA56_13175 [Hormoscilla sp. GM7CHS1pb]|nr:hypothetical protein [Hormoscilla sp. GM7CHS1pb]